VSSPSGVRGRAPAENGFWRILKVTERSFLYLYDIIWGGGAICISVPRSKFLGGLVPPVPPPVIYAHVFMGDLLSIERQSCLHMLLVVNCAGGHEMSPRYKFVVQVVLMQNNGQGIG